VKLDKHRTVRTLRTVVALSTLLMIVFAAGVSWTSWQAVNERESSQLTALVELGEKSLNAYFLGIESGLRILAEDLLDERGEVDGERAERLLKRFKRAYPDLRILILARVDGQILATSETDRGAALPSLAKEPSFILGRDELLQHQTLSIGRAFLGPVSKEWIIPIRYGLRDREGALRFMIGAGLPVSKPESLWKDAPLPPNAALGLLREDLYLVGRHPVPERADLQQVYGQPRTGGLSSFLKLERFPDRGAIEGLSSVSGSNSYFIFRRLANYPVTFYVADPTSNRWVSWWHSMRVLYLLMLLWIATGLVIYRWAKRRQISWELDREQRLAELESANRELESFGYTVSHDLRAPARAIDGYAAMLIEDGATTWPENARLKLDTIRSRAQRMGQLIDDLLALSRYSRHPLQKQEVDVAALVATVLAEQVPADGRTRVRVQPLPACQADPALLRQVFTNLVSNAVKFSRHAAPPQIEIGCAEGAYFVRDNGAGFDMTRAETLFSVFSRLHRTEEFEGTGVGLAIAKRIIERHGGLICARAEPGKGATFSFALN